MHGSLRGAVDATSWCGSQTSPSLSPRVSRVLLRPRRSGQACSVAPCRWKQRVADEWPSPATAAVVAATVVMAALLLLYLLWVA
ncbi:unnamed protein product [Lampetra planeri]